MLAAAAVAAAASKSLRAPLLVQRKQVGASKNTAVMEGPRVKAKWLEGQFSNPLPVDATEVFVQQYARFYILGMLDGMLLMDKSGERLLIMYLQFLNPINNGKNYSWGSAALSWLYRHLCKVSEKTAKQIGGALLLVQLWAWARFPHICPMMRHPHQALPPSPLAIRWKGAKITTEHPMHVLRAYRYMPRVLLTGMHTTIANAPPFHREMSYNDKYMVWFRPCTSLHYKRDS
ncbi:serine/threonine-protein phosphatase 7 long form like protein [Quercus suber]|uniref:Serine/threonine-protein phosphatase 7 long form like protein n=1 Tax=Quercus suber TaxID=58331 RepID=A0AAW0IND3_QUESU